MQGDAERRAAAEKRRADVAVEALSRVARVLDFADEEHDGPITAEVDTDVVRTAIVDQGDDLDGFVLRTTVILMLRALGDDSR